MKNFYFCYDFPPWRLTVDWTLKYGNHTLDLYKTDSLENGIVFFFRFYEKYVTKKRRSKIF